MSAKEKKEHHMNKSIAFVFAAVAASAATVAIADTVTSAIGVNVAR